MTLQQLQALALVVDQGGIRAAARAMHLSPAAVTKAMRTLEDEAGVPLLLRGSRGVALTPAGERLLARARVVTRQVALARDDLQQAAGADAGSVRLGITPFATLTALGEAFAWFRQRYRQVEVHTIEGLMARVLPRLRDGTLDLAVVAPDVGELRDGEFHCQPIRRASQHVVLREGHPLLALPATERTAERLVEQEWVLTAAVRHEDPPRLAAMFAAAGVAPPRRVLVCETLAAMTLLRHSDALSIFPAPLLGHPETRGIVALPASPLHPGDIELTLLTRPDVPLTPAAAYFAHCLAEVAGRGDGQVRPAG
ncbi:LysR family transcriptional regulator [Rubrivivax albus]|uniref:LysR family transcriptional regulator n=1 Tax=Rubrivivax albus TaxID=2499835 RepID=A0A3S2X1B6_9BURK|nr:LysR substrate-binding domain-containing protein [Rubrivivax albus]RVT51564.1 LysR family transcriptional regulator [Rubrivivax albus]